MRIPVGVNIALLTLGATLFYAYVGQLVPQSEVWPPEEIEIAMDLPPQEMVEIGREIADGKGLCLTCHTIGATGPLRFPDLAGVGARAETRVPGMTGLEYLTQSLYDPDAYIVPGFTGGMPAVHRPPVGLTDQEILTVIAWLQSLGGEVTVTMDTRLPGVDGGPPPPRAAAEPPAAAPAAAAPAPGPPPEATGGLALLQRHECGTCHQLDAPGQLEGPSLYDVGGRLAVQAIMGAILSERGHAQAAFRRRATLDELQQMADFLAARRGAP